MKKKKLLKYSLSTTIIIVGAWTALTFYVEFAGPSKEWNVGNPGGKKVLIVFDPDPFYNLDEKVCLSFAKALAGKNMSVKIMTVAAAEQIDQTNFQAFVYCANTYNWRPDWAITNYVKNHPVRENQIIVAVTLGAGSTASSQKKFEGAIQASGGNLMNSYSLWLWRPNDETKIEKPNVEVAEKMAYEWGIEMGNRLPNF